MSNENNFYKQFIIYKNTPLMFPSSDNIPTHAKLFNSSMYISLSCIGLKFSKTCVEPGVTNRVIVDMRLN